MQSYDPNIESSYIMYWDCNNLYGQAMSQFLPFGGFEWLTPSASLLKEILLTSDTSNDGYILEVDLEYPAALHDDHNDYPLAPEAMNITTEMISAYSRNNLQNRKFISSKKLVPNLGNKTNYVVHYRNLKFYVAHGLKVRQVHRVLKFQQSPWLKEYITFNTDKRKAAKNSFEKDFFKLMNNSIYGKTMENTRKHVDVQLVNSNKKAEKLVAAPSFKRFKIFNDQLTAVERAKLNILLDKPIYVGFCILELSKLHMYEFHYDYIKPFYGDRAQLLFTDTDSLTYHIRTEDVFMDMMQKPNLFDFSDYPSSHPNYSDVNKKRIGCFKDELCSEPIEEFVGLRAKMYSILSAHGQEKKTCKGISKHVRKNFYHQMYKKVLFEEETTRVVQQHIISEGHQLCTTEMRKIALSAFDDKRYILNDGVTTLAYGHHRINEEETNL